MSEDRPPGETFDPRTITRPAPVLMNYYIVAALLTLPAFPITFTVLYFRYRTLRYRFDDAGVWMGVGLLFKRETNLAYRRIQDIHVTRGLIQRWFGLATVSIQTASGSATAEMTIEGVLEAEQLRDFLYAKMRGARGLDAHAPLVPAAAASAPSADPTSDEALTLLRDIRDALRAQRPTGGGAAS
jgi:uncharacterized membrane protein YdbT with pleckstrin-like domain